MLASHVSLNWLLTWQTNKVNYSLPFESYLSFSQWIGKSPPHYNKVPRFQFVTLFQILEGGHSMVEYEIRKALYAFIGVLKNPKMHWLDILGWIMVELMYA